MRDSRFADRLIQGLEELLEDVKQEQARHEIEQQERRLFDCFFTGWKDLAGIPHSIAGYQYGNKYRAVYTSINEGRGTQHTYLNSGHILDHGFYSVTWLDRP